MFITELLEDSRSLYNFAEVKQACVDTLKQRFIFGAEAQVVVCIGIDTDVLNVFYMNDDIFNIFFTTDSLYTRARLQKLSTKLDVTVEVLNHYFSVCSTSDYNSFNVSTKLDELRYKNKVYYGCKLYLDNSVKSSPYVQYILDKNLQVYNGSNLAFLLSKLNVL